MLFPSGIAGELQLIGNLTSIPLQEKYTILIKAVDFGVPQLSTEVTVTIRVPLNKPPKLPDNVQFSVYENTTLDTVLGRINATDPDDLTSIKSLLEYSMENEGLLSKIMLCYVNVFCFFFLELFFCPFIQFIYTRPSCLFTLPSCEDKVHWCKFSYGDSQDTWLKQWGVDADGHSMSPEVKTQNINRSFFWL